jgi:hypothetical protein
MDQLEILPQIVSEGQRPPSVIFQDIEGMNLKVNIYRETGWTAIPYDNPEKGIVGWSIFRELADKKEEAILFQHYLFGKELFPNITVFKTGDEFLAELEPRLISDMIEPCDDPYLRQVGFVSYEKAESEGIALVFRISMTNIKADLEFQQKLLSAIQHLRKNHPFNQQ